MLIGRMLYTTREFSQGGEKRLEGASEKLDLAEKRKRNRIRNDSRGVQFMRQGNRVCFCFVNRMCLRSFSMKLKVVDHSLNA
jgi:hypothetical protein